MEPSLSRLPVTTRTILLSLEQRRTLETLLRAGTTEHRFVRRAQIVLLRADGVPVIEIARRLFIERRHVKRWCDRFIAKGLAGLTDRPRSGRPRSLSLRGNASH